MKDVRHAQRKHRRIDVEKRGALARLDALSRGWKEILPADQVRDLAGQLLDASCSTLMS